MIVTCRVAAGKRESMMRLLLAPDSMLLCFASSLRKLYCRNSRAPVHYQAPLTMGAKTACFEYQVTGGKE